MKSQKRKAKNLRRTIRANWQIYLLALPALVILVWFRYVPMYGIQIAFKDYNILKGISGSDWVGIKHFVDLFSTEKFPYVIRNTLLINLYRIIFQFPMPIILALMINECRNLRYKRIIQSVSYLPHFLSWVIISAIFTNLLSLDTGTVNKVISFFGGEQIMFLSKSKYFRSILVITDIWKTTGWGSIIYLAALTAIDLQQYEAAIIDGASKLKRIWYITLPGIKSTIVVVLVMRVGYALADNVEQVLMFYNSMVYDVGDVIGTYIYRMGIGQMKYSFTTAAGLFTSVVSMILMSCANYIAHKMGERGLW